MPDEDGYPTKYELKTIKHIDKNSYVKDMLDHLEKIWHWSDWGFILKGKRVLRLELHTGGWSGNEEIIGELASTIFWMMWWEKSLKGGHYYFKIKNTKTNP